MSNTVIGSTIVIDGEITGEEDLIVQGTVKGRISLREHLHVEAGGTVEANVETNTLTVDGALTGDVHATDRVELRQACRVIGDIRSPRIQVSDGASFKGTVDMDA